MLWTQIVRGFSAIPIPFEVSLVFGSVEYNLVRFGKPEFDSLMNRQFANGPTTF